MDPRPLRHLHFLTETAAHSEDDVLKTIFIDSHSNEKYPGSSLFQSHKDVRESVKKFKDTFKYNVDTTSLSSLIKKTMSYFHDEKEFQKNPLNATALEMTHQRIEAKSRQHLVSFDFIHFSFVIE